LLTILWEKVFKEKELHSFFLLKPSPYTIPRSVIERPYRGKVSNLLSSMANFHALPALSDSSSTVYRSAYCLMKQKTFYEAFYFYILTG